LPVFEAAVEERAKNILPSDEQTTNLDSSFCEVFMRIPADDAETIITTYWEKLKNIPYYVQTALYLSTPNSIKCARNSISVARDPADLLKHIGHHIGLRTLGHPGITRPTQIVALGPYLEYLPKYQVTELWNICTANGWVKERDSLLTPALRKGGGVIYLDDESTFASLDRMAEAPRPTFIDRWLEEFAETGASVGEQIGAIARWLDARKTMAATVVAAEALVLVGRRPDIALLDASIVDATPELDRIRKKTAYAIQRRSLH